MTLESSRAWKARNREHVREYGRRWREENRDLQRELTLQSRVKKLQRGEPIMNKAHHHAAMAVLMGPRPEGAQLSLVNYDSPNAYWGHHIRRAGERIRYRLSTNPDDYAWETPEQNYSRRDSA